jgi:type II secretory pathway component GspD/PulD (secretin)
MLIGRTLLVADNITNSIVAQGPPSALEIVERLLDQIDVKPDQVMISTVIGQMSLNKKLDTGVSYLYRGGDVKGGGGIEFPGFTPGTDNVANALPAFSRSALLSGGLRMYGTIDDLDIFLRALQSKTDFTVLSRPSIFTSNNVKGSISSGERIAIPTSTNNFGTSGNSSTNIEYQDVVLKLEVIPLVNSESEITMEIALLNDEQNGTQTIAGAGSNGDPLTVPKIATRELVTKVTVPNNGTIALGGLIVGRNGKEKSGIPLLSDIPYVGALFGANVDTNDRSELMVFMQPTIVKGATTLNEVQADMDSRYKITPSIQNFANNGVLPSKPENKGKGGSSVETSSPTGGGSNMKSTIRPAHKR